MFTNKQVMLTNTQVMFTNKHIILFTNKQALFTNKQVMFTKNLTLDAMAEYYYSLENILRCLICVVMILC